jgi:hypothetical protein
MASETREPTREEIRERCEEIRKGWSEREHWRWAGYENGKSRVEAMRVRKVREVDES